MGDMMEKRIWQHEFRTWQGRPDPLYQNMMMCRDKSWLAVYKNRLSREELLCACLHDLLPGVLTDPQGEYRSVELHDWASHGMCEYAFFKGSLEEKMAFMRSLWDQGEPAFVGTVHPLLPFSARYNPQLNTESYGQPNHIFIMLGEEAGRYVYFDTSSYKSPAFEAYPRNRELGWISKEAVDPVLSKLFQLGYVVWHEEARARLPEYGYRILRDFAEGYRAQPEAWQQPEGRLLRGRDAIQALQRYLTEEKLDLSRTGWEYDFIDQGDLLSWKLTDLASRRVLMELWLRGEGREALAEAWHQSALLWKRLSTFLLYRQEKEEYGCHPRYGAILEQILACEDKIYAFLENYA